MLLRHGGAFAITPVTTFGCGCAGQGPEQVCELNPYKSSSVQRKYLIIITPYYFN